MMKKNRFEFLLAAILIAGLAIRLYGINWDQGFSYSPHPDERAILMKVEEIHFPELSNLSTLLDKDESPWNPRWFPYGSFPIYLLDITHTISQKFPATDQLDPRILGRWFSLLADLGTILAVALLSRKAFGKTTGLIAAILVSFAVINIQLSHFFAFDTFITFFSMWSLLFLYRVASGGRRRDTILAGCFIGLGLACKISLLPILFAYFTAHCMYIIQTLRICSDNSPFKDTCQKTLINAFTGVFIIIAIFVITQPYALLDWNRFSADFIEQSEMVRRIRDYPYTRQYIDTTPYIYQFLQLGRWGLGWPLAISALLGFIWILVRGLSFKASVAILVLAILAPGLLLMNTNTLPMIVIATMVSTLVLLFSYLLRPTNHSGGILLLSWIVPYLLITGSFEVKFLRYMIPVTPALAICAAALLFNLCTRFEGWRMLGYVVLASIVVGTTIMYGLSTTGIYSQTHPAVRASEYLNAEGSPGTLILKEHWEESLPNLYQFQVKELPIYEPDSSSKIKQMSTYLEQAGYLVLFSNRLYGTVTRIEDRYPLMKGYYKALFNGSLGYELVDVQTSYMSLFGIKLAEETFERVNLPKPMLKGSSIAEETSINGGFADESFSVYDHPKVLIFANKQLMSSTQIRTAIENETIEADIPLAKREYKTNPLMMTKHRSAQQQSGGTWSDIIPTKTWTSHIPVIVWISMLELFSLSIAPLGMFVFSGLRDRGYLLWKILAILFICFITWILSSAQIMKFSHISLWTAVGIASFISLIMIGYKGKEYLTFFKTRWKNIACLEVFFLSVFLAFLAIRMLNPDIWHPYRGGEKPMDIAYLNAVLKSSYMPPYDPWFSGGHLNYYYWGQFIVASFIHLTGIKTEIAYNLAVATFFAISAGAAYTIGANLVNFKPKASTIATFLAGILTFVFVCVAGNMDGLYQIMTIVKDYILHAGSSDIAFDFWRSSRMMPPDPPGHEITEFPFFTFIFADLHAHLMSIPFTLLVIGINLAILFSSRNTRINNIHELIRLSILGLSVGSLRVINTWDLPTYVLITILSITLSEILRHGGFGITVFLRSTLKSAVVVIVAFLAFFPYHLSTVTFFSSLERTTNYTSVAHLLSINGLFIVITLCYATYVSCHWSKRIASSVGSFWRSLNNLALIKPTQVIYWVVCILFSGFILTAFASGIVGGAIPIAAFMILAMTLTILRKSKTQGQNLESLYFAYLLSVTAFLILAFVDIWRIEGDIDRMNTVFKFYLQAWILLAISSSYFLYEILKLFRGHKNYFMKTPLMLVMIFFTTSSLIYPIMGTLDRLNDRFDNSSDNFTLDGYAFMETAKYHDPNGIIDLSSDLIGILWLRDNVIGSPIILEGLTPTYRWGSRVSIHTGLPTVIGWQWHQEQQRWDDRRLVKARISEVNSIYATTDNNIAMDLIRKYKISYIYIGELERLYYPKDGIEKLELGLNGALEKVFKAENVLIMKVNDY